MLRFLRRRLVRLGKDERGFTIVELLVVITVVGILAGVGVSGYTNFRRRAYETAADAAWRDLQVAMNLYEVDEDKPFPTGGGQAVVDAIAGQLLPPPDPLRENLWVEGSDTGVPSTDNEGHLTDPETGFVVGQTGAGENAARYSCVWVNGVPAKMNKTYQECTNTNNTNND